jgi:hypothetical protein
MHHLQLGETDVLAVDKRSEAALAATPSSSLPAAQILPA